MQSPKIHHEFNRANSHCAIAQWIDINPWWDFRYGRCPRYVLTHAICPAGQEGFISYRNRRLYRFCHQAKISNCEAIYRQITPRRGRPVCRPAMCVIYRCQRADTQVGPYTHPITLPFFFQSSACRHINFAFSIFHSLYCL